MKRPWTPRELERLRQAYGKVRPDILASELGRSVCAVYQRAGELGLTFDRRAELGPEFESFLREKHAKGFSDADIAHEWGTDKGTVGDHRRRLGLPRNRFNARHKAKMAKNFKRQLRETGVKSLVEVRWLAKRIEAFDRGWGAVTNSEADVLDQLASGPKTRRMISEAIGWRWPGGRNHVGILEKRGLVVRRGRTMKLAGKDPRAVVFELAPGVARQKQRTEVAA